MGCARTRCNVLAGCMAVSEVFKLPYIVLVFRRGEIWWVLGMCLQIVLEFIVYLEDLCLWYGGLRAASGVCTGDTGLSQYFARYSRE